MSEKAVVARNNSFVYVLTALSCIGGFLFGYDTGVINGALVLIQDQFDLNEFQEELIVGITVGGAMVSAALAGPASDSFGRKPIILISSLVFVCGAVLMAAAGDFNTLLIGRFIVGLGVGSASMCMPMYVSEAAPSDMRGMLVTFINVNIAGGLFVSSLVDGAFSTVPQGWRYMLGLAALPATIQFIGFLFLPESPRWLVEKVRIDQATQVLIRIRGTTDVKEEIEEIVKAIEEEKGINPLLVRKDGQNGERTCSGTRSTSRGSKAENETFLGSLTYLYDQLWCVTTTRRALILGCALQASQQLAGINTVMYYSASILRAAGFTNTSEAIWLAAVVAFFNLMGAMSALYFVEKFGRRPLTLNSLITVIFSLLIIAFAYYLSETSTEKATNNSAVSGSCSDYEYCFDCIQDTSCAFCSQLVDSLGGGSACIDSDDDDRRRLAGFGENNGIVSTLFHSLVDTSPVEQYYPATTPYGSSDSWNGTCASSSDYYDGSCPGSSFQGGWMIFVFLCVYLVCFSSGMGPMPWCLNSEIFPTHIRGAAISISTTINWTMNLLMSLTFLTVVSTLGLPIAFVIYSFISLSFYAFFLFYLPETRGLPLEEISECFEDAKWGKQLYISGLCGAKKDPLLSESQHNLLEEQ